MKEIDNIKPYSDHEVNQALREFREHAFMKALLSFTFPEKTEEQCYQILDTCHSIYDLHHKILCKSVTKLLSVSSDGLTTSGFDSLDKDKPYLYISNHRDIILDTSLLNVSLHDKSMLMTASAIGDNLVKKPAFMQLSKLNRNFIIQRQLPPRETLESSKMISEYIRELIEKDNRSVWIAQSQGRTKDGNDELQQGVLKMLIMGRGKLSIFDYLRKLNIVLMTISYEFDPTDILKMPELIAKHYDQEYTKTRNEDFNNILKGIMGYKGRIHIHVMPLNDFLRNHPTNGSSVHDNDQLQILKEYIDKQTHLNYKLWPSNYIAYDMLYGKTHEQCYNEKQKRQFERRVERRVNCEDKVSLNNFLKMYANPVLNAHKY